MFQRLPDLPADIDAGALMSDLYLRMLEIGSATIASVLEVLADPEGYPVAFYCAAGKDRTGVMSAMVLRMLGVPPAEIARDYALSDAPVESLRLWTTENDPEREDPVPAGVYRAPEATMRYFLRRVDERYGSIDGCLARSGFPAQPAGPSSGTCSCPAEAWGSHSTPGRKPGRARHLDLA
jgi:protein-tyrosine phosphatase